MLNRTEKLSYSSNKVMALADEHFVDAALDDAVLQAILARIKTSDVPTTTSAFHNIAEDLARAFDEVTAFREAALARLAEYPHFCFVRGVAASCLPLDQAKMLLICLMATLGRVSDSNAYDANSGQFADEVSPSQLPTDDPTFQFDTEIHADESSKLAPEDIVSLWTIRAAEDGGDSQLWPMRDIVKKVEAHYGIGMVHYLRDHCFPFGGILRQPPRILRAPIFFGEDGIRFRLGGILDAFEVTGTTPDAREAEALLALSTAIRATIPFQFPFGPNQGVIMLNRQTLHSRTHFRDTRRKLLRIRAYSKALSIAHWDDKAHWSTEMLPLQSVAS